MYVKSMTHAGCGYKYVHFPYIAMTYDHVITTWLAHDWPRLYCTYNSYHMCSSFQAKYYITLVSLNNQTEFELLSYILIRLFNFSKFSAILQMFYVAAAA